MSVAVPKPASAPQARKLKSSLAATLIRTLLLFTVLPLTLMAAVAFLRAQSVLRQQAIQQTQSLMVTQLATVQKELSERQNKLNRLVASSDFDVLIELGLHANPMSAQFQSIRSSVLSDFQKENGESGATSYDQFFIMDTGGTIKVATNAKWQGVTLKDTSFVVHDPNNPSSAVYDLAPLYKEQFVVLTSVPYTTSRGSTLGIVVGVIEPENVNALLRPLQTLAPLASPYFIIGNGQLIATGSGEGSEFTAIEAPTSAQQDLAKIFESLRTDNTVGPQTESQRGWNGISTITQLEWFPALHSGVALKLNTAAIYGSLTNLIPFMLGLVIILLGAMFVVLQLGVRRVTRPLEQLAGITEKFAQGDWSSRSDVTNDDEVGRLAAAFNHMADELSGIYQSLEDTVQERTRQIHTTAEVAQNVASTSNLDEILARAVALLVEQFGFFQASVYLTDRSGKYLQFKSGFGEATAQLADGKHGVDVGSDTILGWVSGRNQTRIALDEVEDSLQLRSELLPGARAEAAVPISIGSLVMGVLDVQSAEPGAFNPEAVVTLQTLASQIAAAMQTVALSESTHLNVEELYRLYRGSHLIAEADNEEQVFRNTGEVLRESPYYALTLAIRPNQLLALSASNDSGASLLDEVPKTTPAKLDDLEKFFVGGSVITSKREDMPFGLSKFMAAWQVASAACIPVHRGHSLAGIIVLSARQQLLNATQIQAYENLAELVSIALEKADALRQTGRHLREVESLASISEAISTSSDLPSFFTALHNKIREVIGNYSFIVALYEEKTDTITIPYSYENDRFISIDAFPLGDGLTSLLIRTRQPLFMVEDTETRAAELGAKIQGKPAKSWMGAPMLVQNNPVGALILQDTDKELAFTDENFTFFTTLAGQVAGVINNVRLLEESKRRSVQLETAAEIARDISGSLNLDELLIKAVTLIRERYDFFHAAVFLLDLPGEFAVIREATGDAGIQMKRQGHKMGVGSKSIVGFVTGRGEQLVVNDTSKDATYYANPLLPDTRSEAAFPLKVGERILGALDVQSNRPYAFNDDNLRSLQILADQMAIAVVNTELFAETQEHLSQHRLLHHITTTVASGTTLEEALQSAVSGLQVTLGGDRTLIMLMDREKVQLEVKAAIGYAEDVSRLKFALGIGVVGWVAAHRRPLRLRDVSEDPRYIQISANTRSELALPLIYRNELLGVLNVESEQLDAYTENDEEMLGTLGGSLAAIIANARLLEQLRLQAERERVIYEVTSRIRRSTDIQSILTTTASELSRVTGSKQTRIQILPLKPGEDELN